MRLIEEGIEYMTMLSADEFSALPQVSKCALNGEVFMPIHAQRRRCGRHEELLELFEKLMKDYPG